MQGSDLTVDFSNIYSICLLSVPRNPTTFIMIGLKAPLIRGTAVLKQIIVQFCAQEELEVTLQVASKVLALSPIEQQNLSPPPYPPFAGLASSYVASRSN